MGHALRAERRPRDAALGPALLRLVADALGHARRGHRDDAVARHAVPPHVARHDLGQPANGGFRRAVVGLSRIADQPGSRADGHDAPRAPGPHVRTSVSHDVERSGQMNVYDLIPLLLRHVEDHAVA